MHPTDPLNLRLFLHEVYAALLIRCLYSSTINVEVVRITLEIGKHGVGRSSRLAGAIALSIGGMDLKSYARSWTFSAYKTQSTLPHLTKRYRYPFFSILGLRG